MGSKIHPYTLQYPKPMEEERPGIVIIKERVDPAELARLVRLYFEDKVKYVVDVRRSIVALGGELHADAEQVLTRGRSQQRDLWGANYPSAGPDRCIEYTALINIRPSQENRSMEITSAEVREQVRRLTFELIGSGEEPT